MSTHRRILVTSALPYANGQIHLGHLLEYIQTDIWVRYQRMIGNECHYVCADDAHGAPIMISAEKQGIDPETMIAQVRDEHERDLRAFGVNFSNYYTTHSKENKHYSEYIYNQLVAHDLIASRQIEQMFDPVRSMFLADRFIKGTCPRCGAPDQYGDSCEVCGGTYNATELIDPQSTLSGETPIIKTSEHDFFRLPVFESMLKQWLQSGSLQKEIGNKLEEWFDAGLQEWDITRDAPYFGFLIPGKSDKYFYVWLDAPIGYIASFENYAQQHPDLKVDDFWKEGKDTELYHFIGKDIVYFHALFWTAVLEGAGFRKPNAIFAHGFVTINGRKMSKSRGTFITAQSYLNHLDPEYLRYYFASKLTDRVEDIDLNLTDFFQKVNSDMAGKLVNIAARSSSFINTYFNNKLSVQPAHQVLLDTIDQAQDDIYENYEKRRFSHVVRAVMQLADQVNQYIDQQQPWKAIKQPECRQQVHDDCSFALEAFWKLTSYLQPIVPDLYARTCALFHIDDQQQMPLSKSVRGQEIAPFRHLFQRVDDKKITAMIEENAASADTPSP